MNVGGTIRIEVRDTIDRGQNVFDGNGAKVGVVDQVDNEAGWFSIAANPLAAPGLFVPYRLVTFIDPHELFVGLSKEELKRDYSTPPPRSTAVRGEGTKQVATTTEPSGYDGGTVAVHHAVLDQLRNKISTGFDVYTADMVGLGKVREYDSVTGLMVLNKGPFSKHDMVVPISVVDHVDAARAQVILIASEADLQRTTSVDLVRAAVRMAATK